VYSTVSRESKLYSGSVLWSRIEEGMNRRHRYHAPISILVLGTLPIGPVRAQHVVHVTPSTVQWGYFAADAKPVLTVKSGEIVTMDTICGIPELEQLGAATDDPIRELKQIYAGVKDKGPGPHVLTGPVAIAGAMPGDVLEVEILDIRLRSSYGWMMIEPGAGSLQDEFPYLREKLIPLDEQNKVAEFAKGIRIPIRPFFGNLGVAPPTGRLDSAPPAYNAGNMDNQWLVAGTKLYIPVQVPGALFAVGDGHAAQGDGEVCLTAIETNLTGVFRFTVRKNMKLRWPRAETPTHVITMGLHENLDEAARRATKEMIDYLTAERGLSRDDAYMLSSAAVDLHITQVVDGVKGVHAMLPKAIFETAR
jgi:acetamidase/formamidase